VLCRPNTFLRWPRRPPRGAPPRAPPAGGRPTSRASTFPRPTPPPPLTPGRNRPMRCSTPLDQMPVVLGAQSAADQPRVGETPKIASRAGATSQAGGVGALSKDACRTPPTAGSLTGPEWARQPSGWAGPPRSKPDQRSPPPPRAVHGSQPPTTQVARRGPPALRTGKGRVFTANPPLCATGAVRGGSRELKKRGGPAPVHGPATWRVP